MTTQKIIDNIQTRLENLISERFTGTYQNIDITCSNYNPSIDSNITITITVTDQNDDPVTGFTVPLKIDGTSISGITTNSNGIATHTYTCNAWGTHKISVKNISSFINVGGWKTQRNETNYQVYENKDYYYVVINVSSMTFSSQSWATHFNIPSPYRPPSHIPLSTSSRSAMGRFATTGDVQVINLGTSQVTTGINGTCLIKK